MSEPERPRAFWAVWGTVLFLAIIHFDFWWWDDRSLWFGFLPVGLGFHALISLAAGITWACAIKYAWPAEVEAWAEEGEEVR